MRPSPVFDRRTRNWVGLPDVIDVGANDIAPSSRCACDGADGRDEKRARERDGEAGNGSHGGIIASRPRPRLPVRDATIRHRAHARPRNTMLEAHDLAARRGTARLFAGLGLAVAAGDALVVTGANGRGKTTLLRMLAGLTIPEAGEIRLDGAPVRAFSPALRAAVTFAGHALALKDEMSARENLASLVTLCGAQVDDAELDAALDRVALGERKRLPARLLSQGQRRRIGLARLALSRRRVWILDEPLTALDAAARRCSRELLAAHLERGGLAVAADAHALALPPARVRTLSLD